MREEKHRIALISFTAKGGRVNRRLMQALEKKGYLCVGYEMRGQGREDEKALIKVEDSVSQWTGERFGDSGAIIFVGAVGIAVRSIAPWIKDKWTDPAVVAVDETGNFVIPLLSGHVGGANELALEVAGIVKGIPVITTATDINRKFAVDVFGVKNRLTVTDRILAKEISAAILGGRQVGIFSDYTIEGHRPEELIYGEEREKNIWITRCRRGSKSLKLVPSIVHIGVGCRRDMEAEWIRKCVFKALNDWDCMPESVASVASIDLKKNEKGLLELAEYFHVPYRTYSAEELLAVKGRFEESDFVARATGVGNVCERAALLSAKMGNIVCPKQVYGGVTVALAEENWKGTWEYE